MKILFLYGFTSSGQCEIAQTLRAEMESMAEVIALMLPKETNAICKHLRHISGMKKHIESLSSKVVSKIERNNRVVNMYLQGFSIDGIFKESSFCSRCSVFRILNLANLDLNRGCTKGPLGPRKKKDEMNNTT
ncbi:MAG: hypothetical protein LUD17_08790 [Bacteroidales bacterium]|nr:hypothetical protein [Bacteroidales bacterium]